MGTLVTFCGLVFFYFICVIKGEGVTSCYSCVNKCNDPLDVEQCPKDQDHVCWSLEDKSNGDAMKGCISNETSLSACNDTSGDVICYTCDEDLCNNKTDIFTGTKKCYFCNGTCSDPLDQVECPDVDGTNYVCSTYEVSISNGRNTTLVRKGCLPDTKIEDCKEFDAAQLQWCSTCDQDLCNAQNNNKSIICYNCDDICNGSLELIECPIGDGREYVCTSASTVSDYPNTVKGCISTDDIESCERFEESERAMCYTCAEDRCNYNSGVRKCYFCDGVCNDPLDQEDCPDEEGTSYVCWTSETAISANTTVVKKGCLPDTEIEDCKKLDESELKWCSTCNDNLCNKQNNDNNLRKCYSCNGTCDDPMELEECPLADGQEYVCMSSAAISNYSVAVTKGCYLNNYTQLCAELDKLENTICYTCGEDLCNRKTGVNKCYSCNGTCDLQMKLEECPDVDGQEYICMSSAITSESGTEVTKGCYQSTIIPYCENLDKSENVTCYICDKDLCNYNYNNGVRKCYSCQGTCAHPLEEEECPTLDGIEYICMTSKVVSDNTLDEIRGCFPNTHEVIQTCAAIDAEDGKTCHICRGNLCNNDNDDNDDNAAEVYLASLVISLFSSSTLLFFIFF